MSRPRGTPKDNRDRAVERVRAGEKTEVVAQDLGVADMTVRRWLEEAGYAPRRFTRWVRVNG